MKAVVCPFCGVVSDAPHETQQACIEALHSEIARTKKVLQNVTEPLPPAAIGAEKDSQLT